MTGGSALECGKGPITEGVRRGLAACANAAPVTFPLQANDLPEQPLQPLQEAVVGEVPPVSISPARHSDLQRQASPQRGQAMQPAAEPQASPSSRAIGWVGPLPPWRGPVALLTAQEGHDLVVPPRLAGGSSNNAPWCRPVTLLIPERHLALRLTLRHEPRALWLRRYCIPAEDARELLRLSSNRDGLGQLHIRVTARCAPYLTPQFPIVPIC